MARTLAQADHVCNGRPTCFGSGSDADSGQRTPLPVCRSCMHVVACGVLRIARSLDSKALDGVPIDRLFPVARQRSRTRG